MRRCLGTLLLLCSFPAAHADKADLTARLDRAAEQTSLYQPTLKPWHLRVSFTVYDDDGKNPISGLMEEWWAGEGQDRITFTSPAFNGTFLQAAGGRYYSPESKSEPFSLEALHDAIVRPLPAPINTDGAVPTLDKVAFGKVSLDCITLNPKSAPLTPPTGLYPTFCFDQGAGDLRFTRQFVGQSVLRNTMGKFQGQSVSIDSKVMDGRTIIAEGKVVTLESMAASAMDFSSAGLQATQPAAKIPGSVVAGRLVQKTYPVYPEAAKRRRAQGDVVLQAVIGTDGHVRELRVLSTPDADLAAASLACVRTWIYKPYVVNGVPTEVDTTVTVQFRIS